ncbi:MAG TPA: cysteine--tRNA ligase, partial [Anaerolineales bacterium]|nr:cysteine--tRNA ligase [Anaerolineales bacterium]
QHAERALGRLRSALRPATGERTSVTTRLPIQMEATRRGFIEAMDDDFNTAGALGYLFDLVRAINQARDMGLAQSELIAAQELLLKLTAVLGLRLDKQPQAEGGEAAPFIDLLLEIRQELRTQKLWALSDKVRDRLTELGVVIEDTREGSTWRWK